MIMRWFLALTHLLKLPRDPTHPAEPPKQDTK